MTKTREQFPLSKKKIIKKTIVSSLATLLFLGFFFGCFFFSLLIPFLKNEPAIALLGLGFIAIFSLLVIALNYWYQSWYYATYFYDITNDYVIIRKSPLTPKEITIPFERIQDVYVDQDILDRLFGLYDVHLSTATFTSTMSAHIDGVESQAADGLRSTLLKKVQERVSRGGMQPQVVPVNK